MYDAYFLTNLYFKTKRLLYGLSRKWMDDNTVYYFVMFSTLLPPKKSTKKTLN